MEPIDLGEPVTPEQHHLTAVRRQQHDVLDVEAGTGDVRIAQTLLVRPRHLDRPRHLEFLERLGAIRAHVTEHIADQLPAVEKAQAQIRAGVRGAREVEADLAPARAAAARVDAPLQPCDGAGIARRKPACVKHLRPHSLSSPRRALRSPDTACAPTVSR
jgi:hypothetical protein